MFGCIIKALDDEKISAGIISFRNLSNGTMKLKIKNSQTDLIDSSKYR